MKPLNAIVLSGHDNASHNGDTVDANQLVSVSFLATFGSSDAAGTFKLQASNDLCTYGNLPAGGNTFQPTNWVDIPSQTASIASGASALLTISNCTYRWLRAVYTRSGGGAANKNVVVTAYGLSV